MGIIKKNWLYILLIILTLAVYYFFAFEDIGKYETADEHYWTNNPAPGRVMNYWKAVSEHDWINTRINDKPGISAALISSVGIAIDSAFNNPPEGKFYENEAYTLGTPEKNIRTNTVFRFPIACFNGLASLLILWLLYRLTKKPWLSLWSFIMIILSPILLGISRIINPDSVLWTFSTISILGFFNFLDSKEKKFAAITSASLGFALLSKYAATVLYLFFLISILADLVLNYEKRKINFTANVRQSVWGLILIILGASAIFAVFMPAVFVSPEFFVYGVIGFRGMMQIFIGIVIFLALILIDSHLFKGRIFERLIRVLSASSPYLAPLLIIFLTLSALAVLVNWTGLFTFNEGIRKVPFNTELGVLFKKKELWERWLLEFPQFVFSFSPIILFAIFFGWISSIGKKDKLSNIVLVLSSFVVLFFAAMAIIHMMLTVRYSIMIMPLALIIAALGLYKFFSLKYLVFIPRWTIAILLIALNFYSLQSLKHYYLNYTSSLLPDKYLISDAWGAGGYAAAEYLNSLPDSENLLVWTDYNGFCQFFVGKCVKGNRDWKKVGGNDPETNNFDYFIETKRGNEMYSDIWSTIKKSGYVEYKNPDWEILIGGRPKNYVRVHKRLEQTYPNMTHANIIDTKNIPETDDKNTDSSKNYSLEEN